jgi:hypothetical protein
MKRRYRLEGYTMTWGKYYWPVWLVAVFFTSIPADIYAYVTQIDHIIDNTLSNWFWTSLHIQQHENLGNWSAATLLIFCAYVSIFVVWLPWHLFFRKFL